MIHFNRFRGIAPSVSKGFTLIELLVVIAIIGILSAVVLASLNTARTKGQDAAVQSNLSTIHVQAELYYGGAGNNSYAAGAVSTCTDTVTTNLFVNDTTIERAVAATESANGTTPSVACYASAIAYAVSSQLPTSVGGTAVYWCVDSTGFAGSRSSALTTTECPGA